MLGLSPLWNAALHPASSDPVIQAGGIYILRTRDRYVRPGLTFARAAGVYEPQTDGSLSAYSGAQVPWVAQGVRLDPGWVQSIAWTHDFSNSNWIKMRSSVQQVAMQTPDGSGIAFKFIEDTSANSHYLQSEVQPLSATRGAFYVKAGEVTEVAVRYVRDNGSGFGGANARVNLLTGEVTLGSIVVEPLAYGWWKLTASPDGSATTNVSIRLALIKAGSENYAGDGSSGVYVLAANATNTAYPVPLTKAEGGVVTVPNPSFQGLLADIGALGDEYTIGVTYIMHGPAAGHVLRTDDGGNNSQNLFYANGAGAQSFSVKASGTGVYTQSSAAPNGSPIKSVARVKANSARVANNGVLAAASGPMGMPPSQTWLRIGRSDSGAAVPAVTLVDVWYAPTSGLSDAQLQALSTL